MKTLFELSALCFFFFKRIPFLSIFAILALISSQVMLLISYFLPIKIILLLASPDVPPMLTSFFFNLGREEIILILTFCVFIVYGLHIVSEKFASQLIANIIYTVTDSQPSKTVNKNTFLFKFIDNFIKSLSTLLLIFVIYLVILFLYKFIGIAIFIYTIIVFLILKFINITRHRYSEFLKITSGLGFMLIFILEIADVLYIKSQDFSILIVLLTLILARYIFNRSIYIMNKFLFLHSTVDTFYKKIEEKKL